jgi:hypothetical protein
MYEENGSGFGDVAWLLHNIGLLQFFGLHAWFADLVLAFFISSIDFLKCNEILDYNLELFKGAECKIVSDVEPRI